MKINRCFTHVGNVVKQYREMSGLSQAKLGEKLSLNNQMISNIERGICTLPLKHFTKVCDLLKIDEDGVEDLKIAYLKDLKKTIEGVVNPKPVMELPECMQ